MATAQQQRPQNREAAVNQAESLLDQVLRETPGATKTVVKGFLEKSIEDIRALLPERLRSDAERLVKRAVVTISRTEALQECTPQSLIRCVVEAAELGLAIDGKLGYAVPYNNKHTVNGRDVWRKEAQFQPSYIGLIAIAKRSGQIVDCIPDIVYENDGFECFRMNGVDSLKHTPTPFGQIKGKYIGAYAIVLFDDGRFRYMTMDRAEIEKVKKVSKSKDSGSSPWKLWEEQMWLKSVVRRALKSYCNDPDFTRACELDERHYDLERESRPRATRSSLTELFAGESQQGASTKPATKTQPQAEREQEEEPPFEHDSADYGEESQEPEDETLPPSTTRPAGKSKTAGKSVDEIETGKDLREAIEAADSEINLQVLQKLAKSWADGKIIPMDDYKVFMGLIKERRAAL